MNKFYDASHSVNKCITAFMMKEPLEDIDKEWANFLYDKCKDYIDWYDYSN